ncbi:MAG: cytochrome c [Rhodobacteraceae bacterium]|nr:cytochrome c [Paracoccaceae bacterium]
MRRLVLTAALAAFSFTAAHAADDPIKVRKSIMQSVGGAAGLAGGMMKGSVPYSPAAGKAAIATFNAAAMSFGSFFPEGSDSGDTTAAPAIWSDADGFKESLAKFASATTAAAAASGREGPADLDAFKEAVMPILSNCKSCHQTFRVK